MLIGFSGLHFVKRLCEVYDKTNGRESSVVSVTERNGANDGKRQNEREVGVDFERRQA